MPFSSQIGHFLNQSLFGVKLSMFEIKMNKPLNLDLVGLEIPKENLP